MLLDEPQGGIGNLAPPSIDRQRVATAPCTNTTGLLPEAFAFSTWVCSGFVTVVIVPPRSSDGSATRQPRTLSGEYDVEVSEGQDHPPASRSIL